MASLVDYAPGRDEPLDARTAWLDRRRHAWGASEIPALLLAYDERADELRTARKYHLEDAGIGRHGVPRIVARKAGLLAAKRASAAMRTGSEREAELLDALSVWSDLTQIARVEGHPIFGPMSPVRDRLGAPLAASIDAIAFVDGPGGGAVAVEAKCTRDGVVVVPWYWIAQLQAQLACSGYARGAIVVGEGWAAGADSAPRWWLFDACGEWHARIRRVAVRAWADVEMIRAGRAKR